MYLTPPRQKLRLSSQNHVHGPPPILRLHADGMDEQWQSAVIGKCHLQFSIALDMDMRRFMVLRVDHETQTMLAMDRDLNYA